MIGNYNFDAQSHRQLYDKIHNKDGGGSSAQAVEDAWNRFRAVMGNAKAEIESAYRDAGVAWEGAAGEAFTSGVAPLAQFAEDARAAGVQTHRSVQAQQSYYRSARDRMPEPVEVSSTANDDFLGIPAAMTHLVGGQTDQDIEEQRVNEAKREAVRVMNDYQSGAGSAVTSIGTFVPPPQVTTQVAETKIEQPSDSHTQYSQQRSDQQRSTATTDQNTPQQQQAVAPPPVVRGDGDTTDTSALTPPTETVPRPVSQPIAPPDAQPTPRPPVDGLTVPATRPNPVGGSGPVGGTGSRGGSGTGAPKLGGGVTGQPGQPMGRGPIAGVGAVGETTQAGRGAPGAAGVRGAAGTPGVDVAAVPQRGQGEEDREHKPAPYLEELDDVWGEGGIAQVVPPVIGDTEQ